jgi:hypothetical protein
MTALVSRCLSAAGVRFLGILSRPGFRPSHDRPTALTSADTSRVSMFHTHETRLGPDALSTPGTAVPSRPGDMPDRRLPPLNGRSLSPRYHGPSRDVFNNGASARVHWRSSLPAFPSPVAPGRNGGLRAFPWAPHPAGQDPAAHARAGTSLGTALLAGPSWSGS